MFKKTAAGRARRPARKGRPGGLRSTFRGAAAMGLSVLGLAWLLTSDNALAQNQNLPPVQPDQPLPVGIGILNAKDYQPIPATSSFDTVVQDPANLDSSNLDNAILEQVNRELVAHGYRVDHEAGLVMLVDGDLVRGTSKDAVIDKIKGIGGEQNDHQGNVFSTNGNTLLTQTVPDPHPNTFRISLSIYDRSTGLYLWRGSIERGTSDLTPDKATQRMVPPLISTIGKSEENRNVAIGTTDQPQ